MARQAPENTRPALVRCIEDGFEWAEVDLRLTRDNQHLLAHDAKIGGMVVAEHTLAEFKEIDVGSSFAAKYAGERPISLPECLALAKGRLNLYLDCKAVNTVQLGRDILEASMERQVIVHDSPTKLRELNEASGGRLALMTKWRPGLGIEDWAHSNHLAAVEIDADQITPEIVSAFRKINVKVQVKALGPWDGPEFWDKAIKAGADWVQTDLPEELLAHALWKRLPARSTLFSLHRGANRYAPENTLPAFEKAIRLEADFVEFDVRTTSDGKFYLLHDSGLDGKTDGHGLIAQTHSETIDRLSAGVKFGAPFARVQLPTLEQFLAVTEGKVNLYFDAKAIAPEALSEAIERHRMAERTIVYQSIPYLIQLKAINPRIRGLPPLRRASDLEETVAKYKPYAFDVDWTILSKELIDRCHALGIKVFSDALGNHEKIDDYLQAINWGIDLIQTDHPMRLLRAMELRAAQSTQ